MGIQNKGNLSKYVITVFAALLVSSQAAWAASPEQTLLKSYQKDLVHDSEQVDKMIVELGNVLVECQGNYLADRVKYRLGVLNFCAGEYLRAYDIFSDLVEMTSNTDVLISALNMKANCARLSGKTGKAISCFKELVQIIEKQEDSSAFETKLAVSGYFSIAQLFTDSGDVTGAIKTYCAFDEKFCDVNAAYMDDYIFKAKESRLQLLYGSGDVKGYLGLLQEIADSKVTKNFNGVFEMQRVCMDFIMKNNKADEITFITKIPVHAVAIVASDSNCDTSELIEQMGGLNKKHGNTTSSAYIGYIYACLLDASGNKQESLKAFGKVIETCGKPCSGERYFYLGEYAKVQIAILSGELKNYSSAIKMIDSVEIKNSMHLSQISESVKKSLAILKQEVPKDDKN